MDKNRIVFGQLLLSSLPLCIVQQSGAEQSRAEQSRAEDDGEEKGERQRQRQRQRHIRWKLMLACYGS